MRNDEIAIEFSFADGHHQLLEPSIVPELATVLERTLSRMLSLTDFGETTGAGQDPIKLYVSSIRSGSIIIGFIAQLRNSVKQSTVDNPIGTAADTTTIIQAVVPMLAFVMVQLGLGEFVGPSKADHPNSELSIKIGAESIQDSSVREGLERVVEIAEKSNAARVTILVPDAPPCNIVDTGSYNVSLIGSRGRVVELPGNFDDGILQLSAESVPAVWSGTPVSLYVGDITLEDGKTVHVLVHWKSRRPPPVPNSQQKVGPSVRVRGFISRLDPSRAKSMVQITPKQAITSSQRRVEAFLTVEVQKLEE